MECLTIMDKIEKIKIFKNEISKYILGREDTISKVMVGLFSGGHVLLEDYPGSGKTTLAKVISKLISFQDVSEIVPFRRIQFTPDLLPSDVLGVTVFDPNNHSFEFHRGPIFANIILADEINRTGPKVQAAFLECMAEGQVTVDNHTYKLDDLFFVIGTQNPLDVAGTYPLPTVSLDRFMLKIPMSYIDAETEFKLISKQSIRGIDFSSIQPVISKEDILDIIKFSNTVEISDSILNLIIEIVQQTRIHPAIQNGASSRAALMFKSALLSYALINERSYVIIDDVKDLAESVLLHRLKFKQSGVTGGEILNSIVNSAISKNQFKN